MSDFRSHDQIRFKYQNTSIFPHFSQLQKFRDGIKPTDADQEIAAKAIE